MIREVVACILLVVLLIGCNGMVLRDDTPACIVNPTAQSRAELRQKISMALHGASVTLAGNALTDSDRLVIERRSYRDAEGNLVMGIETQEPHLFHLVKSKDKCVLVYEADGRRLELEKTTCEPLKSQAREK